MIKDSTPGPDLLGSILSGQSLLLMDSSSMVINRDGSLKLGKPGKLFFKGFSNYQRTVGGCNL